MLNSQEVNIVESIMFDINQAISDLAQGEQYIEEGFGKHAVQRTQKRLSNVNHRLSLLKAKT